MSKRTIRNAIIVGKNNIMAKVTKYSKDASGNIVTDLEAYEGIVSAETHASTRINCLSVVVATLQNIVENNMKDKVDLIVVYTLNQLISCFEASKYWVSTGIKSDGEEVLAEELELWGEFHALYKEVYDKVVFRNASVLNLNKNRRGVITEEQRGLAMRCAAAWDKVNEALSNNSAFVECDSEEAF